MRLSTFASGRVLDLRGAGTSESGTREGEIGAQDSVEENVYGPAAVQGHMNL